MIEEIRNRLAAYQPNQVIEAGHPRAAVLLPLYTKDGALHVVFTKRTDRVARHPGEVSFPGGALEAQDESLVATALREANEEIGLYPEHVRVIGELDEIVTISSFHVSVYVGEIDPVTSPYRWLPQEWEVAEVIEVPIEHLLNQSNVVEVPRQRDGRLVVMEGFRFGEHVIWGATGRMLRNFLDIIAGETPDPPEDRARFARADGRDDGSHH